VIEAAVRRVFAGHQPAETGIEINLLSIPRLSWQFFKPLEIPLAPTVLDRLPPFSRRQRP